MTALGRRHSADSQPEAKADTRELLLQCARRLFAEKGFEAVSVEEIGLSLRAGTKCGTCLPELRSIVDHERHAHAHSDAH